MAAGLASAVAGAAVSGGIGLAGNALLGGGSSGGGGGTPLMVRAGGFSTDMKNSGRLVGRTRGKRNRLLDQTSELFSEQAREFGNLRGLVTPGFGRLTDTRVNTLENRGASRLSNLRQNLEQRRVAGSSFGQAQLQSEMRQLDQDIAEVKARSFLEELDLSMQLLEKETASDLAAVETYLNNLNMEAEFALRVATGVNGALQQSAALQQQLAIMNAQGVGRFIDPAASAIGGAVGDAVGGAFGGSQHSPDLGSTGRHGAL